MCIGVDGFTVHYDTMVDHTSPFHQTDRHFSSFKAAQGGNWRVVRETGTALLILQSSGMSVCLLFILFLFKNSVSFQITDPLINLAEVGQGPLVLKGPTWPPFAQVREASLPPSSTLVCSDAPGCVPACWPSCQAAG